MKLWLRVVATIFVAFFASFSLAHVVEAKNSSESNQHNIMITKVRTDGSGTAEFIELYNPSEVAISLSGWQLQFLTSSFSDTSPSAKPTRQLKVFDEEIIKPHGFYVIAHPDIRETHVSWISHVDDYFAPPNKGSLLAKSGTVRLVDAPENRKIIDVIGWGTTKQYQGQPTKDISQHTLQRCMDKGDRVVNDNNNKTDFQTYSDKIGNDSMKLKYLIPCASVDDNSNDSNTDSVDDPSTDNSDLQEAPSDFDDSEEVLPVKPANNCGGLKISEIGANLPKDEQFIEVKNASNETLALKDCKIMTNRSKSAAYIFGDIELPINGYLAIRIADSGLSLSKTVAGSVSIINGQNELIDKIEYEKTDPNMSWSFINDKWLATYELTPNAENKHKPFIDCQEGYQRNQETGQCNKIIRKIIQKPAKQSSTKEKSTKKNSSNKKRATPKTPLIKAFRELKPCGEGKVRDAKTNRCRKIVGTKNEIKECAEGFERNPETNRCRKVARVDAAKADFAPEKVQHVASPIWGWYVLGGIGALAVGYGGWQWRREISKFVNQIGKFFIRNSK